jgi:IclR family acetate operon transcriptional repressor
MKQARSPQDPRRMTHQSLDRGMRVIEAVASSSGQISLAEIARRTGLHRSTSHHLLQTLVGLGYLRQDPSTRAYELAAKLFQLTGRTWSPEQLGEIAQPYLAGLTRDSGEGSSLAAYSASTVKIVAKREAEGPVRVVQDVGADRPVHATAVGKAIIAFLPRPELDGLLSRIRFERFTPNTIVTRRALEIELARVRETGFAHDDEEHFEGIRCIAAPVFAYTGQVVASLCAVGPKSRMSRQKLRELRGSLSSHARKLSERLQWRPDDARINQHFPAVLRVA